MLSPQMFAELRSQPDLLARLAVEDLSPANTLTLLTRLRKTYSPDLAAAALETARLRQKAVGKFSHADQLFFTGEALQQATSQAVAEHHARLLSDFGQIADLGCGIGGDAIFLGQAASVLALDRDFLRLQMTAHNAAVYGADVMPLQADLTLPLPLHGIPAAFFDPARRDAQKRAFTVHNYSPPLEIIQQWKFRAMLVKISPGVRLEELSHLRAGVEFVSHEGELKEALLHGGDLAFEGFRATCLSAGETLYPDGLPAPAVVNQPLRYLYEPDPSVIRSGLFGELLAHVGLTAYRLDESIAYLTGDQPMTNAWLRCWQIDEWMPFNVKKLKARLVEKNIGSVTVKKRGSPLAPEELQKLLALKKGTDHAIIILTQLRGKPISLINYNS